MCQVVLAVAHDGCHGKPLDVVGTLLAVAVHYVVDGALVILLEDVGIEDVLPHKLLVGYGSNDIASVAEEEDDIVDVRAVGHKLVLLQAGADEALFAVDVEFLVGFDDFGRVDDVEVAQFSTAGELLAVLLLQHTEPLYRILYDVGQVVLYLLHVVLQTGNQLFRLVRVELQDAGHLDFHQFQDIFLGHFTHKRGVVGSEAVVDVLAGSIHVLGLFKLAVLVDALFDEYLLQRGEVQAFQKFVLAYLQFASQQVQCVVHRLAQYVAHVEEVRLSLVDDAAVGRDAYLAVGKGIQGIDGLVARCTWGQVYQYLYVARCQVFHLAYLDFPLLAGLHDGVAYSGHRLAIRNLFHGQGLVVYLFNAGTHAHGAAPLAVVVLADVDAASRLEVGIEAELFVVQVLDSCFAQLVEVVWQYLRGEAHGDALHSLGQQQRELDG